MTTLTILKRTGETVEIKRDNGGCVVTIAHVTREKICTLVGWVYPTSIVHRDKIKTIESKVVNVNGERVIVTPETIVKTCHAFAANAQGCIDEVLNGDVKVNDKEQYIADYEKMVQQYMACSFVPTLAFWQKAVYIQTGECVGILG